MNKLINSTRLRQFAPILDNIERNKKSANLRTRRYFYLGVVSNAHPYIGNLPKKSPQ